MKEKGNISINTENIFPIIKKFLYSDQDIFLRELISNAVDATQKIKSLSQMGEIKEELGDLTIEIILDEKKKTITISDKGIGMSSEEIKKYINQIAFSGATEFIEKYKEKHGLDLADPKIGLIDLQYHDVNRQRGLFYILQSNGKVERMCSDEDIAHAVEHPPQTTRAKLRGDFIRRAKERNRDYTVDWVHLKLNDQAQRTVLCKDPFVSTDDRVQKLIDSL